MKIKELVKGMPVYIDPRCSTTEKTCGLIERMMELMGTVQKIEYINKDENCVEIIGCNWDPADLSYPKTKPVKPIKEVTFDPKELI